MSELLQDVLAFSVKSNLDHFRAEIQEYVESRGLHVFHSVPRNGDTHMAVFWDVQQHPDYREFIQAAEVSGAKLVTLAAREFTPDLIEDALERLSETQLERDERRAMELRLREMRAFEGFVCLVEISFDYGQRDYIFETRTDWFEELSEMLERIEGSFDDEPDGSLGGYYSNN